MKRILTAVLSVILVAVLVFSLVSCGETEEILDESSPATEIISVSTSGEKSESAADKKNTKSSDKKSYSNVSAKVPSTKMEYKINSKYQSMLENKLISNDFNGVVRVSKNGKVVCEAANGTMSTKSKKKLSTDTLFAIASCSKQFTAAAIMILKQEGKLSVNDKLSKYFKKYKYGNRITVKNLLTMRSGLPDFLNENGSFDDYDIKKNASERKNRNITKKWIFSQDLKFTPGGLYDYNNSNYFLLAEIVEKVSGQNFSDFLRERIFKPLGMNHTDSNEKLGYSKDLALSDVDEWDLPGVDEKKQPLTIQVKGLNVGNGGLVSTVEDIDKWLTSLRENTILTKSSVKEMSTDYNKDAEHYGYGVKVIANDGAIWHVGALDYYASFTYTVPSKGYNFIAVNNDKKSMNSDIYTFAFGIINSTK